MQGEHSSPSSFLGLIYERLVPADHLLRTITAAVDFALGHFRACLSPEKFQAIFNEIVHQTRQAGLGHDRLRIIDATHLAAKVDLFRLPPPPPGTPPAQSFRLARPRGALLGPGQSHDPSADYLPSGQLQADGQTVGSRLRPATGSTVPEGPGREVTQAEKARPNKVCALRGRK